MGASTTATAAGGTPGKTASKSAKEKKRDTPGLRVKSNEWRKFDALYKKNPLVFTYLKNPEEQKDPHGSLARLMETCWHCVAEKESGRIPPYPHAPWCSYLGTEEKRKGGPNDHYSPDDFVHTNLH